MKSKRLLCTLVSAILIFGTAVPAFGETGKWERNSTVAAADAQNMKITKEAAKAAAIKILAESFDTKLDDASLKSNIYLRNNYYESNHGFIWEMSWYKEGEGYNFDAGVDIDAETGKVLNANVHTYNDNQQNIATITKDQAKTAAEEFLKKVSPTEFSETKLMTELNGDYGNDITNYDFNYVRLANNLAMKDNFLRVTVNGATGKVTGYNYKWYDNISIPSAEGIISSDKASDILQKNLKLKLSYRPYRDKYASNDGDDVNKLIYITQDMDNIIIDAKTGDTVNTNPNTKTITMDLTEQEKQDFYKNYKEMQKLSGEIDKSKAQQIMDNIIKSCYGDGYSVQTINYQENSEEVKMDSSKSWSAEFSKNAGAGASEERGRISIDALTGGLISLNKYFYGEKMDNSSTISSADYEKSYHTALSAIAKYYPDKVKEINTSQVIRVNSKNGDRGCYFNFARTINGIDYTDSNVNVIIDPKTGTIRQMERFFKDSLNVPEPKNIISEEDAKKIYLKSDKIEPCYIVINNNNQNMAPDYEVKLVYSIQNKYGYSGIDAFTGKLLNSEGEEIDDNIETFMNTIKGNQFEKELSILAYSGIINTKTFDLNKQATNMELIKILVNAKGYRPYLLNRAADLKFSGASKGEANYKYLQMAVAYGIVENKEGSFDPNALVTREQVLKSIVKLIGYDKVAKCKDIFSLKFYDANDVAPENVGYIAIAQGFGIIKSNTDKLYPKSNVTMTELAVDVYRALGVLRSN